MFNSARPAELCWNPSVPSHWGKGLFRRKSTLQQEIVSNTKHSCFQTELCAGLGCEAGPELGEIIQPERIPVLCPISVCPILPQTPWIPAGSMTNGIVQNGIPLLSITPHFPAGTLPLLSHFLEERKKCFSENTPDPPPKLTPINKLLTQLDPCAGHCHHPHGHPLGTNDLLIKRL